MKKFMLALMAVAAILAVSCNKDDKAKKSKTDPGDGGEPVVTLSADLYVSGVPEDWGEPSVWAWGNDALGARFTGWVDKNAIPSALRAKEIVTINAKQYHHYELDKDFIGSGIGILLLDAGEVPDKHPQTNDAGNLTINNGDKLYYAISFEDDKFVLAAEE